MPRLDTLRNRLLLLILGITAAAVGFIYLYVVPQLESSLTAEKLRRLERLGADEGPRLAAALEPGASEQDVRKLVQRISQVTESRVTRRSSYAWWRVKRAWRVYRMRAWTCDGMSGD